MMCRSRADALTGFTYYGEAKYTLSPRLYVAMRLERNKYPFIRPPTLGAAVWAPRLTDFTSTAKREIGYRVGSTTLLKAVVASRPAGGCGPGQAFAVRAATRCASQISQAFDVMNWYDRAREP